MNTIEVAHEALEMRHERLRVRDPRGEKNLLSSLSEVGQQSPVIVVKDSEAVVEDGRDRYVVIDGHKRVRALKKLKSDVVRVAVWTMSSAEALALNYRMSASGAQHALEEGWLIEELHRGQRWAMSEIGKKLLRSVSWVSRRLSLVEELPAWLVEELVQGRMGVHAACHYLLPLTRGNAPETKELLEKIKSIHLTDRQMKELAAFYLRAKPDMRKKIVEDPALFLKARLAAMADPALNDVEGRCVKNLTIIGNISLGLMKSLPEALSTDAQGAARSTIRQAWSVCEERWQLLEKTAAVVFRVG